MAREPLVTFTAEKLRNGDERRTSRWGVGQPPVAAPMDGSATENEPAASDSGFVFFRGSIRRCRPFGPTGQRRVTRPSYALGSSLRLWYYVARARALMSGRTPSGIRPVARRLVQCQLMEVVDD